MSTDPPGGHSARRGAPDESDEMDERLRAALRLEAQRSGVSVDLHRLRAAVDAPREPWQPPRGWRAATAMVLVAGLVTAAWLLPSSTRSPAASEPAGGPSARPLVIALASPAGTAPAPITLDDCQIFPGDARLAFSGWATTDVLGVSGGAAKPGQPVYALVTRGLAEWVGWRTEDTTPMYPAPVGRMGCIFDPSTGAVSQVGVPMDWEPPAIIDGCPASPEDEFAGYREVGGPRAWALLPTGALGWVRGESTVVIYRLTPSLGADESLSGWAEPLVGGGGPHAAVQPGRVVATDPRASADPATAPDARAAGYSVIEQRFTSAGCWVLDVAVNGALAGSAIVYVGAR
jgi:hypothetical protein